MTNSGNAALTVMRDGKGKIFSHVRKIWLHETPEKRARQKFLCVLLNEYGYLGLPVRASNAREDECLDQIDE